MINLVPSQGLKRIGFAISVFLIITIPWQTSKAELNTPVEVKGTVTDATTGEPLPGVSVLVKGTANGVTTDASGQYVIQLASSDAVLVFSFVGYSPQEVPVAARTVIDVRLAAEVKALQEVVVIGYGEQSRVSTTAALSQIKSDQLNKVASSSFANQLAGKVAGIVVNENSGQPGADPQIVIRGAGTLTAGRSPLIVVDGFPLTEGSSLNSINPVDIASIDVLKDASSAAIYGSRSANGVILITTKKGSSDKLNISFDSYFGTQHRTDQLKLPNAREMAIFFTEARDNAYLSKASATVPRSISDSRDQRRAKGASLRELRLNYLEPYLVDKPSPDLANTDWLEEIFVDAPMSSHNIALSGKSGKTDYYVSGNYFKQDGIVINTGLDRFSGTFKLNSKPTEKFSFGFSLSPSFQKQKLFDNTSNDRSVDPIQMALIMYPFFKPYKADGSLAISEQIIANTAEDGPLTENPVAIMKLVKNQRNTTRFFGNTFLEFEPWKGLKLKTMLGGDYRMASQNFFNPSKVGQYRGAAPKPAVARENNESIVNFITEQTVNYQKTIGSHDIRALAGFTFQKETQASTIVTGAGIPDDKIENIAGATSYSVLASRSIWTQVSYFSRIQYAFKDRYLLSVALRRDASSRFGTNKRWGTFPSISAGWIVSEESFFPKGEYFQFVKLRASWGKAGNNQIPPYGSHPIVGQDNYVFGNSVAGGFAATSTINTILSWETRTSADFGIDLGITRQLNLTVDYYDATTKDLLLEVPVPEQSGFTTALQNIGKVGNKGIEFDLTARDIKIGAVRLAANANLSANRNKVLALASGQKEILRGANNSFRTRVGDPISEIIGYQVTGVYKTQEQINTTPHLPGTIVGDLIVADINGDKQITLDDRKSLGNYQPKFTYGFGSEFSWKGIDMSFSFAGVKGRKIYDNAMINSENGEGFSVPTKYYFDNRYQPVTNPDGFLGMPNMGNFSSARRSTNSSSLFVQSADYLRLRNIQIGYTIPEEVLSRIKLQRARIYVSANNLFTITKYRGLNPEATTDNVLTSGYGYTNYPISKSFIVGVNLTL